MVDGGGDIFVLKGCGAPIAVVFVTLGPDGLLVGLRLLFVGLVVVMPRFSRRRIASSELTDVSVKLNTFFAILSYPFDLFSNEVLNSSPYSADISWAAAPLGSNSTTESPIEYASW